MNHRKHVIVAVVVLLWTLLLPAQTFAESVWRTAPAAGIVGDGATLNTEAINRELANLSAQGGGTLYFPPGDYLSGHIALQSNVTLWLEAGAVLRASRNPDDFPDARTRYEGTEAWGYAAFVRGENLVNVSVRGRGTIDGQGEHWWERGFMLRDHPNASSVWNDRERHFAALNDSSSLAYVRPALVEFLNCRRVLIEDVLLTRSPMWTVHPIYCEDVLIRGVTILNPADSKNTDGINPDSSRNVRISDCTISTGDDCIAIKSGKNVDGRRVGRISENITITNCAMRDGHGGVVIGSEMSGGVRNVVVSNCTFSGTDRGIRIKAPRERGGVVENILFNGIVMHEVKDAAVVIDMIYYYRGETPTEVDETTPLVRNITIANVLADGVETGIAIDGLVERPMEEIYFDNVRIEARTAGRIQHVRGLRLGRTSVSAEDNSTLNFVDVKRSEPEGLIP